MKKTSKNVFILYQYDEFTNDFNNIMEYYTIKELLQDNKQLNLKNTRSIYHGVTESLDNIKTLINDKYLIIKEEL